MHPCHCSRKALIPILNASVLTINSFEKSGRHNIADLLKSAIKY